MDIDIPIPTSEQLGIPSATPFGKAFDEHLSVIVAKRLEVLQAAPADRIARAAALFGEDRDLVAEGELLRWFRDVVKRIPDAALSDFIEQLMMRGNDYWRAHGVGRPPARCLDNRAAIVEVGRARPNVKTGGAGTNKNSLTSYSSSGIVTPTMSKPITTWPELRERLAALTSERGAKAALARQFGVTNSAVSEWMRGLSMPSADTTIRLLRWIASGGSLQNQTAVPAPKPPTKAAPVKAAKQKAK